MGCRLRDINCRGSRPLLYAKGSDYSNNNVIIIYFGLKNFIILHKTIHNFFIIRYWPFGLD